LGWMGGRRGGRDSYGQITRCGKGTSQKRRDAKRTPVRGCMQAQALGCWTNRACVLVGGGSGIHAKQTLGDTKMYGTATPGERHGTKKKKKKKAWTQRKKNNMAQTKKLALPQKAVTIRRHTRS